MIGRLGRSLFVERTAPAFSSFSRMGRVERL